MPKVKQLTRQQVVELMRKQQGERSNAEYARELGISRPYLHDIYAGARDPGPAVLRHFGLTTRLVYEPVEPAA